MEISKNKFFVALEGLQRTLVLAALRALLVKCITSIKKVFFMEKHKVYIAIDDTDEIGYYTSTGEICEEIKEHIHTHYSKTMPISRHQLLLDDAIAYTSHNSSMCFTCELDAKEFEKVKNFILLYVKQKSAPSASPGICMGFEKDICDRDALIAYGLDAKEKVLTKETAYKTAAAQNFFLQEVKNKGNGIIGALAGVALRAYGSDGRIKGKIELNKKTITIAELLNMGLFEEVRLKYGKIADKEYPIMVDEYLKGVYIDHKFILLVAEDGNFYKPLVKENLLNY